MSDRIPLSKVFALDQMAGRDYTVEVKTSDKARVTFKDIYEI